MTQQAAGRGPQDIIATYERVGPAWARQRNRSLFERPLLERFLAALPGPRVLDLGCGSGEPIATFLAGRGCVMTGVDAAAPMVELYRESLPTHRAIHADMRGLELGERYHGIVAFDSFFHLSPADQSGMFAIFARHALPGAALVFTSGPNESEAYGTVEGEPVYHASLSPKRYRELLARAGFDVIEFRPDDPECDRHSHWLAKRSKRRTEDGRPQRA